MYTPLSEQYKKPEVIEHAQSYVEFYAAYRHNGGPDSITSKVGSIASEAALIRYLESLTPGQSRTHFDRKDAIMSFKGLPLPLIQEYGVRTLSWLIGNGDDRFAKDLTAHLGSEGYHEDLLQKSRTAARYFNSSPKSRDVMRHYRLMDAIQGQQLHAVDLAERLQESRSDRENPLTDKRLGDYALQPLKIQSSDTSTHGYTTWQPPTKPGVDYSMWLDTPTGFCLTYKGTPQVTVGLTMNTETNELVIQQLQRKFGKRYDQATKRYLGTVVPPRGLMPLDWQRAMVGVSAEVAQSIGITSLAIRGGRKIPSRTCKISEDQAIRAYDAPAERLGFTEYADGDWHISLPLPQAA